ncbi:hypothetical protein [Agromyces sp. ZXT2-6]|uniref:hypothetical protein n=1 Tax=Agromyces sp. ZXT2-6 TaxID=3461153 RepID=UPI0040551673
MVNTAGTGNPDLKHEAGAAGHRVADTAKQEARDVASETKYQVRNLADRVGSEVRSQASTQQHRAAGGIRDVGSQFSEMAANSTQSGLARDVVENVGARADSVANWLDQREPQDLLDEVKRFARRRPGVFLAIAAGAGVVIGRLTRSLASSDDDDTTSTRPTGDAYGTGAYGAGAAGAGGYRAGAYGDGTGAYGDGTGSYGNGTRAHVAEPGTAGGAAPRTGVTGTEPYVEPIPSGDTRRGDVTGAP